MRELIYAPIVHTEVDMGSLSESAKREYISRYGNEKWEQHVTIIGEMWVGLRKKIFSLNLPYERLRIYQDGLPVCGKEVEIAREIAGRGSPNHRIVMELIEKGARLEGTEDPALLVEEYRNIKRLYQSSTAEERLKALEDFKRSAEESLVRRDNYIARRIDSTLGKNEIGILFIGLQHAVNKYLKDMKVTFLIYRLPFTEGYEAAVDTQS